MAKTRARTEAGKFIPDDPSTPQNEAWVDDRSKKKTDPKKKMSLKDLPPVGSSDRKRLVLQGIIKE
jgi:hypothetical protein